VIRRRPQRIVALLPSATEILYGLGLGDRVVGVSHECDYPPEVLGKPRVTMTAVNAGADSPEIDRQVQQRVAAGEALYGVDVGLLGRLQPDLIVTQAQCDVCAVRHEDVLRAVAELPLPNTQVVALNPQSLADLWSDVRRVAAAAAVADRGETYVAGLQRRVEKVRSLTGSRRSDQRPRAVLVEWIEPLMLAGNWMPELVELAGARHDLTEAGRHSRYVPWERVIEHDPQWIGVCPCGFDVQRTIREAERLPTKPGWSRLSAVQAGRVFAVDGNAYFNRSGPRLVDSLEILAHLLHPELFPVPESVDRPDSTWRPVSG